jgi:uncharacterized protein (DUF2147 family)
MPTDPGGALAKERLGEEVIVGEWWTEDRDGRVRFFKTDSGTYSGELVWMKDPRADTENDDPALRARPVVGILLIWELRFEDGEYVDGYVYNPEDGNTFRVEARAIDPDSMEVRGYFGISLLGQSQVWTREQ